MVKNPASDPKNIAISRQPRPTMTDVAKLAGVSQSTVSMVLNNVTSARLSADTRSKVLDAALSIGYQLSKSARHDPAFLLQSMRSESFAHNKSKRLIVYLVDEISTMGASMIWIFGCPVNSGLIASSEILGYT